ncbi:MAG: aconitase X catalytic domain-containing protein [Actinobacteria bacterium]|nr:aconitase X catalytic domain-containing protein [Actinomycetota bacterium]
MVTLSGPDQARLAGVEGPGMAMAMDLVVATADQMGAFELLDITSAHIDSCLFHGMAGLDFVQRLVDGGATVAVPSTLNVSSLDLLHPDLYRGDQTTARLARELMDAYVALGCTPTWTCAPYQKVNRPSFGEQVAWAESNATVFVNSVLGARSNRYGDFIDISCAITGRAPAVGLHLDQGRQPTLHIEIGHSLRDLIEESWFYPTFGYVLGELAGAAVAIVTGLPPGLSEDRLKSIGASAATSGSVALFHAAGSTPEAGQFDYQQLTRFTIERDALEAVHIRLSTAAGRVDAVSLGAPHYSGTELRKLRDGLAGRRVRIPTYVNTSRDQIASLPTLLVELEALGLTIVTDTCTYITPILDPAVGVVMTDSAKWAHYAPGNLGVEVVYASLTDCIMAAVNGG